MHVGTIDGAILLAKRNIASAREGLSHVLGRGARLPGDETPSNPIRTSPVDFLYYLKKIRGNPLSLEMDKNAHYTSSSP
jgi:hypothetical protein